MDERRPGNLFQNYEAADENDLGFAIADMGNCRNTESIAQNIQVGPCHESHPLSK